MLANVTPEIHIGPAGWSYPDWAGIVYPAKQPKTFDPLAFLASYFNLIEINNTFYRVPARRTCSDWVRRVDDRPGFVFTAKAPRDFTHRKVPAADHEIQAFKLAIEPIYEKERLGAVLLQFPWSFRLTPGSTKKIKSLVDRIAPFPTAVEVRHGSWQGPDAAAFFRDSAIPMCGVDQPLIGQSLSPDTYSPGEAGAYFRLHGRNRKTWFNNDAGRDERYNYLYSEKQLEAWRDKVRDVRESVQRVFVVLNNHFRGQAVANALQLDAMISGSKSNAPPGVVAEYPHTGNLLEAADTGPPAALPDRGTQLFLFGNDHDKKNDDNPDEDR